MLPLDALSGDAALARAVFEEDHGVRRILLANGQASAAGVSPGMSVNAALALLPALGLEERNPSREERALKSLATWAECFTSMVSLEAPALLLEIAGSLRLFGGLEALWQRIESGLGQRDFSISMAMTPTPLASLWLARAGRNVRIKDTKTLTGALAPLPLRYLEWPESVRESLNGMGLNCIGDCLRLPRQGFVRRFGAGRLLQLDRALGRLPDPRVSYRAPERFCREYELDEEQHDSERLLEVCRQLLMALERFLTTRQVAVQQVRFDFFHLRRKATRLAIGCKQASGEVDRWFELLEIRFDGLTLPAPVIAIRLSSGHGEPVQGMTPSLPFDRETRRSGVPIAHLVERLSARMGNEAVHGVALVAEHRPQYAWEKGGEKGGRTAFFIPKNAVRPPFSPLQRPLWMLPEPMMLKATPEGPSYEGPLELAAGPERIETGWWDGNGIARDYFVAVNPKGMHLWIYRNRSGQAGWYLHGIFG